MRFTGHLDLHRTWERVFRRAQLPLAYSHGFHPQPRINVACALPLGFTSQCEVADIWLEGVLPLSQVEDALKEASPPGIDILEVAEIDGKLPPLQTLVTSVEYTVTLLDTISGLDERIEILLSTASLPRTWRDKGYDLRPLVEDLSHLPSDKQDHSRLFMRLSARAGATGRPEEVLSALGIDPESARVHRTSLHFSE